MNRRSFMKGMAGILAAGAAPVRRLSNYVWRSKTFSPPVGPIWTGVDEGVGDYSAVGLHAGDLDYYFGVQWSYNIARELALLGAPRLMIERIPIRNVLAGPPPREKILTTAQNINHEAERVVRQAVEDMGWRMGLEPTTTGITIRSPNSGQVPDLPEIATPEMVDILRRNSRKSR